MATALVRVPGRECSVPALLLGLATAAVTCVASPARADHEAVNETRPSAVMFLSQSLEGESTNYHILGAADNRDDVRWRGFGVRTGFGFDLFRALEFGFHHTLVNSRSQDDSLENLKGSRFSAESKIILTSPIVNVEVGGGVSTSRLDYQRHEDTATVSGEGSYLSLSANRFLASNLSLFGYVHQGHEQLERSGGTDIVESLKGTSVAGGAGIDVWF